MEKAPTNREKKVFSQRKLSEFLPTARNVAEILN
jgi:hypothetical protein